MASDGQNLEQCHSPDGPKNVLSTSFILEKTVQNSADTVAEQKLGEQKLGMVISYSSVMHGTAQG